MGSLSPFKRRMFDVQGYEEVSDDDLGDVGGWMKFPFFLCASLCLAAMALESTGLLWALTAVAAGGAASRVHPMDLVYNHGVRHLTGTGKLLPRSGLNRGACALATAWLLATLGAHAGGMIVLYQVLGWSLVAVAYLVGTFDICIPSYVFRLFIGFPAKRDAQQYPARPGGTSHGQLSG